MKKEKIIEFVSFGLALICLIVGASFHGYRLDSKNQERYQLGVDMGISIIALCVLFLVFGITILILLHKNKKELMWPLMKVYSGSFILFTVIWGYMLNGGIGYMYELTCLSNLLAGLLLILNGIFYQKKIFGFLFILVLACILPVFLVTVVCSIAGLASFNFSGGFFFMHAINPLIVLAFFAFTNPFTDKKENLISIFTAPLPILLYLLFDLIRYYVVGELVYGLIPTEYLFPWVIILIALGVYILLASLGWGLLSLRQGIFNLRNRHTKAIE
ncbi:MAG: hypothetical protein WCR67_07105 [Bacilli bacterium]|jgi:hypothetical protein